MRNLLKVGLIVLILFSLAACASTSGVPIDIPVDVSVAGSVNDINTNITNTVRNIVNQVPLSWLGIVIGLACLVGWLLPSPVEIIRGFFVGLSAIISGIYGIFKK